MTSALRPTGQGIGTGSNDRPVLDRTGVRLLFLIPGGLSLLLGLNAALLLLGVWAPLNFAKIASLHAPLMVFGFVGTLIVLERAVAARKPWGYLSPALLGVGSLLLLSEAPSAVGKTMIAFGFIGLVGIYLVIWKRLAAAAIAIQALGAIAGLIATLLWLVGSLIPAMVPGMAVFLILTIVGERLELARVSPTVDVRSESFGLAVAILLVIFTPLAPLFPQVCYPLLAVCLGLQVVWLLKFDVAPKLISTSGLPRYMAICLMTGYIWLLVPTGVWLINGPTSTGPLYDATLHSIFLGFVMSMIMAHAPVILPAVLRKPLPYRAFLYIPVVLLHASLVLRLLGGDAWGNVFSLHLGGALNVISVLLFAILAVTSAALGPPSKPTAKLRKKESK